MRQEILKSGHSWNKYTTELRCLELVQWDIDLPDITRGATQEQSIMSKGRKFGRKN